MLHLLNSLNKVYKVKQKTKYENKKTQQHPESDSQLKFSEGFVK